MSKVVAAPSVSRSTRSRGFTREVWVERVARFPSSGLTAAQFCALEAVSLPSFYAWRRRLAAEAKDVSPPDHSTDLGARLLPVKLPAPAPPVELVLTTGAGRRLPPGSDLAWVRSLVAALGEPSC